MDTWPLGGVLVAVLLHFAKYHVTATHFRGVHMWWDSLDGARYVNLYYRVAWKREWRDETYCDSVTIDEQEIIGPPGAGYMKCVSCQAYDVTIGNMLFRCTDYSALEDWSAGVGNHSFMFPTDGQFSIKWAGTGWLDGVHGGHDRPWSTRMKVDIRARADTGRSNSSPRVSVPPVLRLQHGCHYNIKLPVTDPDGDVIRCRWAVHQADNNECGGICGAFEGAELSQENCTLEYTANGQVGYYAAAIQIEDFIKGSPPYISGMNSLSSVPLQFLLYVYESEVECSAKPSLIPPTPPRDTCVILQPDQVYTVTLVARVKDEFITLSDFETVSLFGMNKSEVTEYGDSGQEFSVDVMWTPTHAQQGQHVFCFSAVDGQGTSSEQRCIYILVTEDIAPVVSSFDYNVTSREVTITFDQPVKRPVERRYVYIYSTSSNTAIMTLDTSNGDVVFVNDDTLSFRLTEEDARVKRQLYIWLDQGAVQSSPNARCGVDSVEVKDQAAMVFDTVGSPSSTTTEPSTTPDVTDGPQTPGASSDGEEKNYTWLIVVVVVLVVLFAIIVVVAVVIYRRKKSKDKYSREERQEEYARSVASKVATNVAYEPDFNDIDVKFR